MKDKTIESKLNRFGCGSVIEYINDIESSVNDLSEKLRTIKEIQSNINILFFKSLEISRRTGSKDPDLEIEIGILDEKLEEEIKSISV